MTTPTWVVPGRCDFCPRPGPLAHARCACQHTVGVNICPEKHAQHLEWGEIGCRVCAHDIPGPQRHYCVLTPAQG